MSGSKMGEKVLRLCWKHWKFRAGSVCLRRHTWNIRALLSDADVGNICASQAAHKPGQGKFPDSAQFPEACQDQEPNQPNGTLLSLISGCCQSCCAHCSPAGSSHLLDSPSPKLWHWIKRKHEVTANILVLRGEKPNKTVVNALKYISRS